MSKWIQAVVVGMLALLVYGCGYGTIKGVVVDDANNPLVGVNVYTDPPTNSVMTDEDGYTIRGIPVGIYTVRAAKIGYRTGKREVDVRRSQIANVDIALQRSLQ